MYGSLAPKYITDFLRFVTIRYIFENNTFHDNTTYVLTTRRYSI